LTAVTETISSNQSAPEITNQDVVTHSKPTAQVLPLKSATPEKPSRTSTTSPAENRMSSGRDSTTELYGNAGRPESCVRIVDLHRYIQQEKTENPTQPFQREFAVSA
jgi:hypothetical protein